jgi:hypothetical protein
VVPSRNKGSGFFCVEKSGNDRHATKIRRATELKIVIVEMTENG